MDMAVNFRNPTRGNVVVLTISAIFASQFDGRPLEVIHDSNLLTAGCVDLHMVLHARNSYVLCFDSNGLFRHFDCIARARSNIASD